jgi:hypothetical protein
MKSSITLAFAVLLVAQCGRATRSSQPSLWKTKEPGTETENKQCDFSSYNPLPPEAQGFGSPVLSMPQPEYSAEARERKLSGRIQVNVLINVNTGLVERACALDGDETLKRLAEAAALKIRLSPYNDYIKHNYRYAQGVVVYNFAPS